MEQPAPIYKLKISIRHAPYPLWRRIIVRGDDTLLHLHGYIQQVMRFDSYHLWRFDTIFGAFSMDEDISTGNIPPLERISDLAKSKYTEEDSYELWLANEVAIMDVAGLKMKFLYTYDFGDDWEHVILVEDIAYSFPKVTEDPPYCLGGRGGSPIEDCGGVWGLANTAAAWMELQELKKQGAEFSDRELEDKFPGIMLPDDENWMPKCVHPSHRLFRRERDRLF